MAPLSKTTDWHPAMIMAALRMSKTNHGKGWTLRGLSLANGYSANAVGWACRNPNRRLEEIIAEAIGVEPREIWPSRYGADGTSKRRGAHPLSSRRPRHVRRSSAA